MFNLYESVLVLNQNYEPLYISSAKRAFILVYLKKAELVENSDFLLRAEKNRFPVPTIIRLLRYVNLPFKKVSLNRLNIFKRDGNECVYCGAKKALTLDHIIPKSLGGKDSWENLVTACSSCNSKKGNRKLEDTDMELKKQPYKPSHIIFLREYSGKVKEAWRPYLYML